MPSLLTEVHAQKSSVGILSSVLAPRATILGSVFAIKHCEKYKNYIRENANNEAALNILSKGGTLVQNEEDIENLRKKVDNLKRSSLKLLLSISDLFFKYFELKLFS